MSFTWGAGLGRAPATALAYMYWCRGFSLGQAMETLYAQRPCCPRIQSIRQATVDLLSEGSKLTPVTISVSRPFLARTLQVCGPHSLWAPLCLRQICLRPQVWWLGSTCRPCQTSACEACGVTSSDAPWSSCALTHAIAYLRLYLYSFVLWLLYCTCISYGSRTPG